MGAHLLTPSRAARRVAPGSKQHALAPAREAAEHALHAEAAEHAPRVHDAAGHVPETGRCTQWPTRATATGLTVYCVSGGVPEGRRGVND